MKKFLVVLMMVLSMVGFGQTFKEAMNDPAIGSVRIGGIVKDTPTVIKYLITDGRMVGLLTTDPNDVNIILKTDDPTALPGAGKRQFEGWYLAEALEILMYQEAAKGNYFLISLDDYRAYLRRNGKKNAQKSRL